MDVAEWLRGLGLEQYASAFRDNDIDGEAVRGIRDDRSQSGKTVGRLFATVVKRIPLQAKCGYSRPEAGTGTTCWQENKRR
jgi:hypothetical protein